MYVSSISDNGDLFVTKVQEDAKLSDSTAEVNLPQPLHCHEPQGIRG